MNTHVETTGRAAILVEDAARIRMMGFPILEALPARSVPYDQVDPFILLHEARLRLPDLANVDTRHPHRGFDNLWYVIAGSASTGHSTGPGGAMERARLRTGALLALRTGRGAWHAEALGADEIGEGRADTEFRSVLFWVNLARKDKTAEPRAQVLQPEQIPVRQAGDATVRVLVGEGSPVQLGTPALILDIELPTGGAVTHTGSSGVPELRLYPRGRGHFRCQSAPGQAAPARPARPRRCVHGHGCGKRHAVPADGRTAVSGDAAVQRAIRGLGSSQPGR